MDKESAHAQVDASFFPEILSRAHKISPRAEQFLKQFASLLSSESSFFFPNPSFTSWEYPIGCPTASPLCSKSMANCDNKKVFRCFDCMEINTALLCYDCFVNSNHKGHTYLEFETTGGCCDCGDDSLWNQNGFCPTHSKKKQSANLPPELRDLFVAELGLVYYLYFRIVDQKGEYPEIHSEFGEALFAFSNKIIQYNYETKLLMAELMKSSFQDYPSLASTRETVLASIFHLEANSPVLEQFRKFAFEMYPVESFRPFLLREYFQLTRENTFTWEHPIKKFNFQYLTCVRTINRLIREKSMQPLQLDPTNPPTSTAMLGSIFKKYYEDCNYLRKMKESRQYFQAAFQLTNACDMAFYRIHTSIPTDKRLFIDEYYLKSLAANLQYISNRKDLIVKTIRELFAFVVDIEEMTFSMAQERGFAMCVITLLEGDLARLRTEEGVEEILKVLKLDTETAAGLLRELARKSLRNVIALTNFNHTNERNGYENYFYSVYPERELLLHLDLIYQKILMLLGHGIFDYWEVAEGVMLEFMHAKNGEKMADQSSEEEGRNECYCKMVSELSSFLVKLFTQELNEITVCNLTGIVKEQKIIQIYLKVINTYANKFSVKDIKTLCSFLVNNPDIFARVLEEFTVYENGKLKMKAPIEPIEKHIYMDSLKGYKHYEEIKWEPVEKISPIKTMEDWPILSERIIMLMIKNARSIMPDIEQEQKANNKAFLAVFERQIVALLQTFLLTQSPLIKQFFTNYIVNTKIPLHTDIINHINTLCKQRWALISQKQEGERQKQDDHRRKREKVELKRKQKELLMRKNQELMLKQYNAKEEEVHESENCIYCKEQLRDGYQLLCYVNLTNLVSKFVLKQTSIHLFITTCGHKVHEECYTKYGEEKKQVSTCFLCKKRTNIIIPSIPKDVSEEARDRIVSKFLDSVFATLLSESEEKKAEILNEMLQQEGNIMRAILKSIVKEAIYYGLHIFESFRKYSLQAYQLVYNIIKLAQKESLAIDLSKLQQGQIKNSHPLDLLQRYAYRILRKEMLSEPIEIVDSVNNEPHLIALLQKIISLIANPSKEAPEVSNISIITAQNLMKALPVSVSELHEQMGECPFCKKITNWLYYCLLCEWRGCNKETAAFHKHSKEDHLEGSVFISAGNGKTSVVCCGYAKNQDSLYENAYGESYTHNDENMKKSYLNSFKLNAKKYGKFYEQIISHNLQNLTG